MAQRSAGRKTRIRKPLRETEMPVYTTAVERSGDSKLGKGLCSATWVTQYSCNPLCKFNGWSGNGGGCYTNVGPASWTQNRLNNAAAAVVDTLSPETIAEAEAIDIAKLTGRRPLRVHASGDCDNDNAARIVAAAAADYQAKHGAPVWSYTHSWEHVARESWGVIAIQASCETAA